jgi:hypothetical protein
MYAQAQANCLFFVDPCTSLQLTLETNRERTSEILADVETTGAAAPSTESAADASSDGAKPAASAGTVHSTASLNEAAGTAGISTARRGNVAGEFGCHLVAHRRANRSALRL